MEPSPSPQSIPPPHGKTTPSARDTVAGEVRAHLARRGHTASWLATQTGMTDAYLGRRISPRGTLSLDANEIEAIARALGLEDPRELFGPRVNRSTGPGTFTYETRGPGAA